MSWFRRRASPSDSLWRRVLVSECWRPEDFLPQPLPGGREPQHDRQPILGALLGALLLIAAGLAVLLFAPGS